MAEKRLTGKQMQEGVQAMMRWHSQRKQDKEFLNSECEGVVEAILAELEATEEQTEDVEAEPGACGKNCTCPKCVAKLYQECREIRLKAQIEKLTKERDELKVKVAKKDRGLRAQGRLIEAAERERDELKDVIDQVRSVRDELKAKVEELEAERDDLRLDFEDTLKARDLLWKERDQLKAKLNSIEKLVKAE
jgi:chromosome segregation ATPase